MLPRPPEAIPLENQSTCYWDRGRPARNAREGANLNFRNQILNGQSLGFLQSRVFTGLFSMYLTVFREVILVKYVSIKIVFD